MDLALNNLQRLMCHKTQQTKPNLILNECVQNFFIYMRHGPKPILFVPGKNF